MYRPNHQTSGLPGAKSSLAPALFGLAWCLSASTALADPPGWLCRDYEPRQCWYYPNGLGVSAVDSAGPMVPVQPQPNAAGTSTSTPNSADESLSARAEKPTRNDAKDAKTPDKDFTLGFDLPVNYASNVVSASVDSVLDSRSDGHAAPEISLKWSHQYEIVKATAQFAASVDRYFNTTSANSSSFSGSLKLEKTDGKSQYFVPYASTINQTFFIPTFSKTDIMYNDVAMGFWSGFAWRPRANGDYSNLPFADAGKAGDISVKFDVQLGRRLSDVLEYQNNFVVAKTTVSYSLSEDARVDSDLKLRGRFYENYYGEKRRDLRVGASIGLFWTPEWLKKISSRSELSVNFDFYRNQSNIPNKTYSVWELGPMLSLRTKF